MPSFNFIAPYYDFLARLVYGNNLNKAKKYFLNQIPPGATILLMGGGTGAILNELLQSVPDSVVDFVEPSPKMIAIAKERLDKAFTKRVNFICGTHNSIPNAKMYDVATSFFVIDCFTPEESLEFGNSISSHLKPTGIWLFADFYTDKKWWHGMLIWIMYRFFRLVAQIHARHLPDYELIFQKLHFQCKAEQPFIGGLICTKVYKMEKFQKVIDPGGLP